MVSIEALQLIFMSHLPGNGLGVFWSKLIALLLKDDGVVLSVWVCTFQWYFTGRSSFSGIL